MWAASANTESILDILSSNIHSSYHLPPIDHSLLPGHREGQRCSLPESSSNDMQVALTMVPAPPPATWASPSSPLSLHTFELVSYNNVLSNPSLQFLQTHLLTPNPSYFPSFGGCIPECNLVNSKCFGLVFQALHQTTPQTNRILTPSRSPSPAGLLTSFMFLVPLPVW